MPSPATIRRGRFEALYRKFNHRRWVHPDPVEFIYRYKDLRDREIAGLVASSLAYGRVEQILKSVSAVLDLMESPRDFLVASSMGSLYCAFKDFRHRFTSGDDLATMLYNARCILLHYGSLYDCFLAGLRNEDDTVLPALTFFVNKLSSGNNGAHNTLLPSPQKGSACKRMNLYLRWMVRKDEIDPGGWEKVPSSKLIVPLDTHMHRISLSLCLTKRRQADMRTAVEITRAFKDIAPEDPVRYDFALTRIGIWR